MIVPPYSPLVSPSHDEPDRRLWGFMRKPVTPNKCYETCVQFADAPLGFLRNKVPKNWGNFCETVAGNFRVIDPKDFRVMA